MRIHFNNDLMINLQRVENGAALHVIRYDRDGNGRSPVLPELEIDFRLPGAIWTLSLHSPAGEMTGESETSGQWRRLYLRNVSLYSIALLESE